MLNMRRASDGDKKTERPGVLRRLGRAAVRAYQNRMDRRREKRAMKRPQ